MSDCAIGIDLGGQSAKLALVDRTGRIRTRRSFPVRSTVAPGELIPQLVENVSAMAESSHDGTRPTAIGMVMPGYMDAARTQLVFAANLPALSGNTFLGELKAALPLPVEFDADSNAAALAEWRFGAGVGVQRLIVVTVGTGIGGGVIIDGRVLRIREHIAGSLGHVIVNAKGPKCACGATGCIEALAASPAMERLAAKIADEEPESRLANLRIQFRRLTPIEVSTALAEGDPAAQRVVRECGWWLGVGIASWAAVYAPQRVLIGGGMARLGDVYLEAIRCGVREVGQPHLVTGLEAQAAGLGADAGVIGAAAMVMSYPQ